MNLVPRTTAQRLLLLSTLLAGCVLQHSSTSQVADATTSVTAPSINYYNTIAQIFDSRCAPCHYQGNAVQLVGSFADKTYQGAQAPYLTDSTSIQTNASLALGVMSGSIMPPANNLGPNDVANLQTWIKTGMPLGDPSTAPQPSLLARDILDRRCVACHHPGGAVDLTTYDSSSGPIHSPLIYTALNVLKNMPPSGNLTADELKALSDWSSAGGPRAGYDGGSASATGSGS